MSSRDLMALAGASADDYVIASPFGLGDTYLLAALCQAFRAKYCRQGQRLLLIVKESHRDLAEMFDGVEVRAVPDAALHHKGLRSSIMPGVPMFAHPSFVDVRSDYPEDYHGDPTGRALPGRMSDAAMYAMILGLHPATPLTLPKVLDAARAEAEQIAVRLAIAPGRTVILSPEANSWPAAPEPLWSMITDSLSREGWTVVRNDPARIPLRCVIPLLEIAGWFVGSNCGLMQTIVLGRAACRKTILTKSVHLGEVGAYANGAPLPYTCVYGFRKVDGHQYDVEEFRVDDESRFGEVAELLATGRNARGPVPDPRPTQTLDLPTAPGDVIDALIIMQIKRDKLGQSRVSYRDIAVLCEVRDGLARECADVPALEAELRRLNEVAWDNNEILIQTYADPNFGSETWVPNCSINEENALKAFGRAHRSNQERVRVKNKINAACRYGSREEKSYAT